MDGVWSVWLMNCGSDWCSVKHMMCGQKGIHVAWGFLPPHEPISSEYPSIVPTQIFSSMPKMFKRQGEQQELLFVCYAADPEQPSERRDRL